MSGFSIWSLLLLHCPFATFLHLKVFYVSYVFKSMNIYRQFLTPLIPFYKKGTW